MATYYGDIHWCTAIILSLIVLSCESPLDLRIRISEDHKLEHIHLQFAVNSGVAGSNPYLPGLLYQRGMMQNDSNRLPPSDNIPSMPPASVEDLPNEAVTSRFPGSDPYLPASLPQLDMPQEIHDRPTSSYNFPSVSPINVKDKEEPSSDNRLLHLDFGISAPWVLPLPIPSLSNMSPAKSTEKFTTIKCSNTSFAEDVFCDLRALIPSTLGEVITKVYYVLLRYPHPYLSGINCTVVLQPRNGHNIEDEDEEEHKEKDEEQEEEAVEDEEEDEEDEEDNEEDEEEEEEEDEKEDKDKVEEEKNVHKNKVNMENKTDYQNEDPFHLFYDRSYCKPNVTKNVLPVISMADVTYIRIHFFGKEFTHLSKLVRNYTESTRETDAFPLIFMVSDYIYVSPVTDGGQEAECREDSNNRCRP